MLTIAMNEITAIYNAGSAGKCTALLRPIIVGLPQNQSVPIGSNVIFTVAATGTQPISYQWLFNGTNIAGATNVAAPASFRNSRRTHSISRSPGRTNFNPPMAIRAAKPCASPP